MVPTLESIQKDSNLKRTKSLEKIDNIIDTARSTQESNSLLMKNVENILYASNQRLRTMNKKLKSSKLKQLDTEECIDALETIDDELLYFNEENKRKLSMSSVNNTYRKTIQMDKPGSVNKANIEKGRLILNKRKKELDRSLNVSGKGNYESNMLAVNLPENIKDNIG